MKKRNISFQEFQQIAKNVLKELTDYCDQHNLRYTLAYGTLIGAVRHKDIIPWDYDIDIQMPRPDFEEFMRLTNKVPINDHLKVFSWENCRNYYLPFLKVCDTRTRLVITKTQHTHIPLGIWVDIFPLDGLDEDMEKNIETQRKINDLFKKAMEPFYATHTFKEKLWQFPLLVRSVFIPSASYCKKHLSLTTAIPYASTENIGYLASIDSSIRDETYEKQWFNPIKMPFGAFSYNVPQEYDRILRQQYGDYMQLPPEEKRQIPNIRSYWIE